MYKDFDTSYLDLLHLLTELPNIFFFVLVFHPTQSYEDVIITDRVLDYFPLCSDGYSS